MKKIALLICAGALVLVSCGGHGPPCAAYSSVKKVQDNSTAMAKKHNKVIPS